MERVEARQLAQTREAVEDAGDDMRSKKDTSIGRYLECKKR